MAWRPCWMTKQNVLSSNMAATPLSFGSPGIGCKPRIFRISPMLTALNNTRGEETTESCFCLLTIHTRTASGPVILIHFFIRIPENCFAVPSQQLPHQVCRDGLKNATCDHHLRGQCNAVALVHRS